MVPVVEFGDARLPQRFWSKVSVAENGCWVWTAFKDKYGYGRFCMVTGISRFSHRLAYEFLVGPIPAGLEIDHTCHNPACVNPTHLEPVTHKVNVQRGKAGLVSGQRMKARTHCPKGHPYDATNTYFNKDGGRICKACSKIKNRAAWLARKGGVLRGI